MKIEKIKLKNNDVFFNKLNKENKAKIRSGYIKLYNYGNLYFEHIYDFVFIIENKKRIFTYNEYYKNKENLMFIFKINDYENTLLCNISCLRVKIKGIKYENRKN